MPVYPGRTVSEGCAGAVCAFQPGPAFSNAEIPGRFNPGFFGGAIDSERGLVKSTTTPDFGFAGSISIEPNPFFFSFTVNFGFTVNFDTGLFAILNLFSIKLRNMEL